MSVHPLVCLVLCLSCLWMVVGANAFGVEQSAPHSDGAVPTATVLPGAATLAKPAAATPPQPAAAPLFSEAEWNHDQKIVAAPASGPAVAGRAVLGLCFSLVAIIVVAVAAGWVIKRLGAKRVLQRRGRHLDLVETVPLGFKRSLSLVRLGNHVLVIGQGEHELHHLATLPASVLDEEVPRPRTPGTLLHETASVLDVPAAPTADLVTNSGHKDGPNTFRRVLDQLTGRP